MFLIVNNISVSETMLICDILSINRLPVEQPFFIKFSTIYFRLVSFFPISLSGVNKKVKLSKKYLSLSISLL